MGILAITLIGRVHGQATDGGFKTPGPPLYRRVNRRLVHVPGHVHYLEVQGDNARGRRRGRGRGIGLRSRVVF